MPFSNYFQNDIFQSRSYFDEVMDEQSRVRDHWRNLIQFYQSMGIPELVTRKKEVERLLRENGVTYNIYGDPEGMNRPWILDPVPMVFSSTEWNWLEAGLMQRVQLLNIFLKDLYTERKILKDRVLPLELIYNHNGFIRQLDQVVIDGDFQLITYSADLARGPDGRMWVLNDRTDAPSGAGYTLENRAAMMRVFPDLFRTNQVRKIGTYYQTLKNTLASLGLANRENPRIVVLSPGPSNETFFEHAYLSSYLGYTLVFGDDLTVRDGSVWLKTLQGLEKVDVILRRLDDLYCDPLELKPDSHLGVVGLLEAIRKKNVLLVNPLGCRILENPGIMAFLPQICRYYLNEDLQLPSVMTWWCGHPWALDYVLQHFDQLIIKRIYRNHNIRSVFGGELNALEKEKLRQRIKESPELFVGQDIVRFSTTPALIHDRIEARNAVFRSYLVADVESGKYQVMPGGLSRSSPSKGIFIVSNQSGGISKDTWVMGKEPEEQGERNSLQQYQLNPVENIIPSRTGEHLYWLGRYLERCSSTIRLLRVLLRRYNESDKQVDSVDDLAIKLLLQGVTQLTGSIPGFLDQHNEALLKNPEPELIALVLDKNKAGSLAFSVSQFLSNGYAVRDRLSLDTWRIIDSIDESWNSIRSIRNISIGRIHDWLDKIIVRFMAFTGLNIENMTRESSWRLLNIGRKLESAHALCTMLRSLLVVRNKPEVESAILESVLICNESLVTYRYRNRSQLNLEAVLELLLADESNPRALVFYIQEINQHLNDLPKLSTTRRLTEEKKVVLEALTMVRLADLKKLAENNSEYLRFELDDFLARILDALSTTSNHISIIYFSHLESQYQFMKNTRIPEL
jgi:uncharacterized circularly permuted ATP-grasp superfamily protein/uncharacterized alpha-E superfamily protein